MRLGPSGWLGSMCSLGIQSRRNRRASCCGVAARGAHGWTRTCDGPNMQNVASGRAVGAARGAEHKAKQASGSPEIVLLERAGLATRGVVYIIVGVLAVLVALGKGGGATDSGGALAT